MDRLEVKISKQYAYAFLLICVIFAIIYAFSLDEYIFLFIALGSFIAFLITLLYYYTASPVVIITDKEIHVKKKYGGYDEYNIDDYEEYRIVNDSSISSIIGYKKDNGQIQATKIITGYFDISLNEILRFITMHMKNTEPITNQVDAFQDDRIENQALKTTIYSTLMTLILSIVVFIEEDFSIIAICIVFIITALHIGAYHYFIKVKKIYRNKGDKFFLIFPIYLFMCYFCYNCYWASIVMF